MHAFPRTLITVLMLLAIAAPATAAGGLELVNTETVPTGAGVKSVILSPDGSRAYTANLEGMSVYEYDRASRTLLRKVAFVPHIGKGYNYTTKEDIKSYQEKPVEQHITHNGRYLWVSLHNADGVVVWDLINGSTSVDGKPSKEATMRTYSNGKVTKKEQVNLLLVETGRTPKIITSSPDGRYLFVANWHTNTVTVMDISGPEPADWTRVTDIPARIPRGLVVSPDSKTLYIAEMATEMMSFVDLATFKKTREVRVGLNPRHVLFEDGQLYISLNLSSRLARLDLESGKIVRAGTCRLPRTIAKPAGSNVLFSVCYRGDRLQAFSAEDLTPLGEWETDIHPVGLDLHTDGNGLIEAWVANYTAGTLNVFTFRDTSVPPSVEETADITPEPQTAPVGESEEAVSTPEPVMAETALTPEQEAPVRTEEPPASKYVPSQAHDMPMAKPEPSDPAAAPSVQ